MLRRCCSVVRHESQSADVCSVPPASLHAPTISLLPGNPLSDVFVLGENETWISPRECKTTCRLKKT